LLSQKPFKKRFNKNADAKNGLSKNPKTSFFLRKKVFKEKKTKKTFSRKKSFEKITWKSLLF